MLRIFQCVLEFLQRGRQMARQSVGKQRKQDQRQQRTDGDFVLQQMPLAQGVVLLLLYQQ